MRRQRVAGLLLKPLLFYMHASNGGREKIEGRNDYHLWAMW